MNATETMGVGERVYAAERGVLHAGTIHAIPGFGLGVRWDHIRYPGGQASTNLGEALTSEAYAERIAMAQREENRARGERRERERPVRELAEQKRRAARSRRRENAALWREAMDRPDDMPMDDVPELGVDFAVEDLEAAIDWE